MPHCLLAVVLFGSRACDDAHETSDWDSPVMAEGPPQKAFERHPFLKRLQPASCRGVISLISKTPYESEARLSSLFLDMTLDGPFLYDPRLRMVPVSLQPVGLPEHEAAGPLCRLSISGIIAYPLIS